MHHLFAAIAPVKPSWNPDSFAIGMVAEKTTQQRAESGEAAFVPITLEASPVEIELPNGGIVRLPLGGGQAVLVRIRVPSNPTRTTAPYRRNSGNKKPAETVGTQRGRGA